jgi:hypothetical protein
VATEIRAVDEEKVQMEAMKNQKGHSEGKPQRVSIVNDWMCCTAASHQSVEVSCWMLREGEDARRSEETERGALPRHV